MFVASWPQAYEEECEKGREESEEDQEEGLASRSPVPKNKT